LWEKWQPEKMLNFSAPLPILEKVVYNKKDLKRGAEK
jgi:hypothetical protein